MQVPTDRVDPFVQAHQAAADGYRLPSARLR
jgi:hypothetical protein